MHAYFPALFSVAVVINFCILWVIYDCGSNPDRHTVEMTDHAQSCG